jgi:hypothetical protein
VFASPVSASSAAGVLADCAGSARVAPAKGARLSPGSGSSGMPARSTRASTASWATVVRESSLRIPGEPPTAAAAACAAVLDESAVAPAADGGKLPGASPPFITALCGAPSCAGSSGRTFSVNVIGGRMPPAVRGRAPMSMDPRAGAPRSDSRPGTHGCPVPGAALPEDREPAACPPTGAESDSTGVS